MLYLQETSTAMELLPLLCLCLLTRSGITSADENGPTVITVGQGNNAVLPCSLSTKENIEFKQFVWRKVAQKDDGLKEVFMNDGGIHYNNGLGGQSEDFKGRVFHFPDQLKHGNASIIIRNTKISDSGEYTCHFPYLQPHQTFYIKLVLEQVLKDRSRENSDASPKPCVTSLEVTKNWARLQCKVKGASPKPEVEWQDSDGNKLPAEERPVSNPGGPDDIILLTTVTKTDNYSCVVTQRELNHQTASQIHVYIHGPTVVTVKEEADVVLPCSLSTKENIEFKLFVWRKVAQKDDGLKKVFLYDAGIHYNNGRDGQSEEFKGRVSHFPDELKHGNASIIIRNTKISDSGNYTCDFPILQPPQIFYIDLVVGAVSKPYVTTHETKDGVLLQCKVHGSPKPRVEWQDSAGNILPAEEPQVSERGGRFYITLRATVTETDDYRCVATQETISHQISTRIYVNVKGPEKTSGSSTGWIFALVLLALFALAVLVYMGYITFNCNEGSPTGWIVAIVFAGVLAVLVCMGYITFNRNEEFSTGWTVGLVLLALVAVVALVVLAVLVYKCCNPLKHNKGPGTVQMQPQEKPSCGSTPEPNALHPFMMEERH